VILENIQKKPPEMTGSPPPKGFQASVKRGSEKEEKPKTKPPCCDLTNRYCNNRPLSKLQN
jgi:hypothetical protein